MKYILLQAPPADEDDYAPQILIVDNSTKEGEQQVEMLCKRNYQHIGMLESDLAPKQLIEGFNNYERKCFYAAQNKLWKLRGILDE